MSSEFYEPYEYPPPRKQAPPIPRPAPKQRKPLSEDAWIGLFVIVLIFLLGISLGVAVVKWFEPARINCTVLYLDKPSTAELVTNPCPKP